MVPEWLDYLHYGAKRLAKRAGFNTKDLVGAVWEESFVISLGIRSVLEGLSY